MTPFALNALRRTKPPKQFDLNLVRIAAPCPAEWEKMAGDDRIRHCSECNLNVYNLSAMTEIEIQRLLAKSTGRVCARFYRRADGTMLTQDCPRGIRAVVRRASRAAVAVVTALMGAGLALGQSAEPLQGRVATTQAAAQKSGIALVVTDSEDAVIAGAKLTVRSKDGKTKYAGTTNNDGKWRVDSLGEGE